MRAGGNLVQVTPGTEQTIAETIETMLMHGKVQREELIVCTTFPRKLDPYLASAPPGLPASVYFTPDPYNEKLKETPPLSVTDASHPMIVEDFDEVLQYSNTVVLQWCYSGLTARTEKRPPFLTMSFFLELSLIHLALLFCYCIYLDYAFALPRSRTDTAPSYYCVTP
jgi:hypothetical protein